jgi:DNA-binding transcriptional LysR family regulator
MEKRFSRDEPEASLLRHTSSPHHNPHLLDWNYLRTFYYVARAESFTKASEYLHLAQSSLSRTIQNLEARLGEKLFVRTPKKLILTRAGELVFEAVSHTFAQIEFVRNRIEEDKEEPQGDIRIRAGSGFISLYLLKYIPDFLKRYPDIRLSISSGKTIPELDLLETDVVIRPPLRDRNDLIQIPLLINHVKLYASKEYLSEFGTPQHPEDLDHHRLIAFGNPPGLSGFHGMNWHLTLGAKPGHERKAFIEVDLPEDRLHLAAAGLGITTGSAEHPGLEQYKLVEILGRIPSPTVQCYYIYSEKLQASKRIKLLSDYLVESFTKDYGTLAL